MFSYLLGDGTTRREYRPQAEVFHKDSLETFSYVPVTNDHPPEMVDAKNARKYTVGLTGEQARADGEFVRLPLNVFDGETIEAMARGKVQISVGYVCDLDMAAGTAPSGERYDAVQRNIRVNHVALVDEGRAGPDARVRMDAADCIRLDVAEQVDATETPSENLTDKPVTPDAQTSTPPSDEPKDPNMEELDKAKARITELEAALKEAQDKLGGLQGERDALKTETEKADKERTDAAQRADAAVRNRVALITQVTPYVEGDLTAMSERDLKVAAIKKLDAIDVPKDASPGYIDGYFAAAISRADAARKTIDTVRTAAEAARNDEKFVDPRDAMIARQNAAFKPVKGN